MKTKRLFISTLIAAAAMGLTAYANEAATQTTPVIAETDAPEGADKLLPLADAPAAEEADAPAEETQDADALELLLADDVLVELDEAAAPDELSTETMMREWIARYAAAARFAGIRSVKGTGGGLSSGGAVATAGDDLTVSAAAPTPSVSVPAAGTVSLADALTRASAADISLGSASASDAGTVSVATASSAAGTSTILPAAFFSTRSVFSAVPAAAASYSLAGSSGVSAASAETTTTETNWTTGINTDTGHPLINGFAEVSSSANSGQQGVTGNTVFTFTSGGNIGASGSNGFNTAGYDVQLTTSATSTKMTIDGNFLGSGNVWFERGRWATGAAGRFAELGDIYAIGGQIYFTSAETLSKNFFLGTGTFYEGTQYSALNMASLRFDVNVVFNGKTTILSEGTKLAFNGNRTATFANLTGSGDISFGVYSGSSVLKVTGATDYTGKINLVSGVTLNWTNATATFGGLSGTAGTVAGGSYLNIKDAKDGSTFAGTVGSSTSGVTLNLTGSRTQAFTGTNYFSSVSVGSGATLDLSGSTTTLSSSIQNSGTVAVSAGTRFNITSLASLRDADGNYAVISGGTITDWNNVRESNFSLNGTALSGATIGRYTGFAVEADGKITFTATAANLVWTNAANGTWDMSAQNWTNTSTGRADAFVSYDSVEFNKSGTYTVTVASGGVTADIMKVSAGTVSFSGGTVTALGGVSVTGGTLNLSTNVFAAGTAFNVSGGALTLGNAFALTAGTSIDVSDSGTVSGTISSMTPGSSLTLAGTDANNKSTVSISGSTTLSGSLTIGNATVNVSAGNDTFNWGNSTKQLIVLNEGGTLNFGATRQSLNSYVEFTLNGGTIIGAGDADGAMDFYQGNTVKVTADSSIKASIRLRSSGASGDLTFDVDDGATLTVSGVINKKVDNNTRKIVKTGDGKMILSGDNSNYSNGGFSIQKGTLVAQSATALGSGAIAIANVGTLELAAATGTVSNVISGAGAIKKTGSGTVTLAGTNTSYSGQMTIESGTLVAGNASALGAGNVVVADGATLARGLSSDSVAIGGSLMTEGAAILNLGAVSADTAAFAVTGDVTLSARTIFSVDSASAGLKLISSASTLSVDGLSSGTVSALNLSNLYVGAYLVNQRGTATFEVTNNTLVLSAYEAGEAWNITWAGGDSGVWNANGRGWTKDADRATAANFQHGDSVTFSAETAGQTIRLSGPVSAGAVSVNDDHTFTFDEGAIFSASSITVASEKTLSLSGVKAGTLTGTITLESGTLAIASPEATLASEGTIVLKQGATLDYGSSELANNVTRNLSAVEGTGTILYKTKNHATSGQDYGNNKVTLSNAFTGDFVIGETGAQWVMADGSNFGGSTIVLKGDSYFIAAYGNVALSNKIRFDGNAQIWADRDANRQFTLNGDISGTGTFTKKGAGTVTLNGAATITTLTQSAGTLNINGEATITTLTQSAGTLNISGAATKNITNLTLAGTGMTVSGNLAVSEKISVCNAATATQSAGTVSATRLALNDSGANTASFYTLQGGVLNITGGGKENSTGGNAILIGHWSANSGQSKLTVSGGTLNAISGYTLISWDSAGQLEISGGTANLYAISLNSERANAANVTLSSGRLNLGKGGLLYGGTATDKAVTLSGGTLGALTDWSSDVAMNITGNVTIDTTKQVVREDGTSENADGNIGSSIELSGGLSGDGALKKAGAGMLTLSGANSYRGGTTIENGTLVAGSAGALGSERLTAAGSDGVDEVTLRVGETGATSALTLANDISISAGKTLILESANAGNKLTGTISGANGALKKAGAGTLTLSGTNTYTGGTTIENGTLVAGSEDALGSGPVSIENDATLKIGVGAITINGLSGAAKTEIAAASKIALADGTENATVTLNITGDNSYSGYFDGAISLVKRGTGTLDLTGNNLAGSWGQSNTFSGTVEICEGTIKTDSTGWGSKGNLNNSFEQDKLVLKNGGVLEVTEAQNTDTENEYGKGGAMRGFSVTEGEGTYRYTGTETSRIAPNLNSNNVLQANSHIGLADGATLIFDVTKREATLEVSKVIANTTPTGTDTTSGTIEKTGAGTLKLTGDNSKHTGNVKLSAGTLELGHNKALGSSTSTLDVTGDSELKLGSDASGNALTVSNKLSLMGTLIVSSTHDGNELSGSISASGQEIRKVGSGTLTLSGTNTGENVFIVNVAEGKIIAKTDTALGAGMGADVADYHKVRLSGGTLEVGSGVTLAQTNIEITLSDLYKKETAITGAGKLADGTTIKISKAETAAMSLSAEAAQDAYKIYAETLVTADSTVNVVLSEALRAEGWSVMLKDGVYMIAIPEPSLFGLLAGVTALGFSMSSRRRRKKA